MRRAMTSIPRDYDDDDEILAHRVRRDKRFIMIDETRPRLFIKGCFETCAVCLEEIVDAVTIAPCGHGNCEACDARLGLGLGHDMRTCVLCKQTAPADEYETYDLPAGMRARHMAFESDLAQLGTLLPERAGAAAGAAAAPQSAERATYGVASNGATLSATLVHIEGSHEANADVQDGVVFVLDASGSMATADAWDALVNSFDRVLRAMVGKYIALLVFNDTTRVLVPARVLRAEHVEAIVRELREVQATGSTALDDALERADEVASEMSAALGSCVARIVLVTDGDASNKTAARRAMAEMKAPVFAFGFGSGYSYDVFAELCADVKGRGDSSTVFEHASTIERLIDGMNEPRSMGRFRLVLSDECASSVCGHCTVFFNGETRSVADLSSWVFEGTFVRSIGTRIALVGALVGGQSQSHRFIESLYVNGAAAILEPSAVLCTEVKRFVLATRATEYVMQLSVRTPEHDVHTHAGLLGRTRAALIEIGPSMSGVIGVIDERLASMHHGCDSNKLARAASCAVRALTCGL